MGLCITIEGSDGAGKATTTKLLYDYLTKEGYKVATMSFPRYNETKAGKVLSELLKSERKNEYDFINMDPKLASMYYIIDRGESRDEILKLKEENDYLILDRYSGSNFTHQGGKIKDEKKRKELIEFFYNAEHVLYQMPLPDKTFYLYLPTDICMKNKLLQRQNEGTQATDAGEDDFEYLENANQAGLWCAKEYGWEIINCYDNNTKQQLTREEVLGQILKILKV